MNLASPHHHLADKVTKDENIVLMMNLLRGARPFCWDFFFFLMYDKAGEFLLIIPTHKKNVNILKTQTFQLGTSRLRS